MASGRGMIMVVDLDGDRDHYRKYLDRLKASLTHPSDAESHPGDGRWFDGSTLERRGLGCAH